MGGCAGAFRGDCRTRAALNRAASISNTSLGAAHASARLIAADASSEIIVIRAQLVRAIVAHPIAASIRTNLEVHAGIWTAGGDIGALASVSHGKKHRGKGEKATEHDIFCSRG